ncbi:bacterioferritin-associated ferredoxin [Haliea atlantica]|jgi:bacterioferritin-associated ferredoxin|nr:(2Fe-2S)-binding protein [Haliea sp.]MAL96495.1 (2Fe-2S)-binding protein [Haliea sp.]|tara:strand:+ start:194 stop:400 length:207 start_codon:yes stop_codon:yes gene_type:complete
MYVCICKGITDHQIRAAVSQGAENMRAVRQTLGVASQCGKCGSLARDIMREALDELQSADSGLFYAAG